MELVDLMVALLQLLLLLWAKMNQVARYTTSHLAFGFLLESSPMVLERH